MFIDLSQNKGKGQNDVTECIGKVTKGWRKELKRLSEAYSSKKKLKKTVSYAEWSRFILKHTFLLFHTALYCYTEFVLAVNKLNCIKRWLFMCTYTEVWLK
jgi:hypothetical protein